MEKVVKTTTRIKQKPRQYETLNTDELANVKTALRAVLPNNFQLAVPSPSLSAQENNWRPVLE